MDYNRNFVIFFLWYGFIVLPIVTIYRNHVICFDKVIKTQQKEYIVKV